MEKERKQKEKGGFRLKKDCETAMTKAIHDPLKTILFFRTISPLTLDNIVQNFLTHTKATKKLNTSDRYESLYNNHIKERTCRFKGNESISERLETLFANKKDLSGSTLQLIYTVINSSYDRAIKQKKLNDNPCKYIDRPVRGKVETEVLTIDEVLKVLDKLDLNKYNDYIMFIALNICLELGLRRGELAALQWKHIDKNNKKLLQLMIT